MEDIDCNGPCSQKETKLKSKELRDNYIYSTTHLDQNLELDGEMDWVFEDGDGLPNEAYIVYNRGKNQMTLVAIVPSSTLTLS